MPEKMTKLFVTPPAEGEAVKTDLKEEQPKKEANDPKVYTVMQPTFVPIAMPAQRNKSSPSTLCLLIRLAAFLSLIALFITLLIFAFYGPARINGFFFSDDKDTQNSRVVTLTEPLQLNSQKAAHQEDVDGNFDKKPEATQMLIIVPKPSMEGSEERDEQPMPIPNSEEMPRHPYELEGPPMDAFNYRPSPWQEYEARREQYMNELRMWRFRRLQQMMFIQEMQREAVQHMIQRQQFMHQLAMQQMAAMQYRRQQEMEMFRRHQEFVASQVQAQQIPQGMPMQQPMQMQPNLMMQQPIPQPQWAAPQEQQPFQQQQFQQPQFQQPQPWAGGQQQMGWPQPQPMPQPESQQQPMAAIQPIPQALPQQPQPQQPAGGDAQVPESQPLFLFQQPFARIQLGQPRGEPSSASSEEQPQPVAQHILFIRRFFPIPPVESSEEARASSSASPAEDESIPLRPHDASAQQIVENIGKQEEPTPVVPSLRDRIYQNFQEQAQHFQSPFAQQQMFTSVHDGEVNNNNNNDNTNSGNYDHDSIFDLLRQHAMQMQQNQQGFQAPPPQPPQQQPGNYDHDSIFHQLREKALEMQLRAEAGEAEQQQNATAPQETISAPIIGEDVKVNPGDKENGPIHLIDLSGFRMPELEEEDEAPAKVDKATETTTFPVMVENLMRNAPELQEEKENSTLPEGARPIDPLTEFFKFFENEALKMAHERVVVDSDSQTEPAPQAPELQEEEPVHIQPQPVPTMSSSMETSSEELHKAVEPVPQPAPEPIVPVHTSEPVVGIPEPKVVEMEDMDFQMNEDELPTPEELPSMPMPAAA